MIYLITKTFPPVHNGGGAIIKQKQYLALKKYFGNVKVICAGGPPNNLNSFEDDDVHFYRLAKNQKLNLILQRIGYLEDYLDGWADNFIANAPFHFGEDDLFISLSGGDLGSVKLCNRLSEIYGSKYIIHFHDPIDHSEINGERMDYKYHPKRSNIIRKCILEANGVITSCLTYNQFIKQNYRNDAVNFKFGFDDTIFKEVDSAYIENTNTNIIYAGTNGYAQQAEQIIPALNCMNRNDINLFLYGDPLSFTKFNNVRHCKVMGNLSSSDMAKVYLTTNRIGYASLKPGFFRNCFPSKIYEYIGTLTPIFAILPRGEAFEFINNNRIGIAVDVENINDQINALNMLSDPLFYKTAVNQMLDMRKFLTLEKFNHNFCEYIKGFSNDR